MAVCAVWYLAWKLVLSEISFVQELLGVPKPPQEVTQTGELLEAPLSLTVG